jgi:Flp pilus assembly protein TadD
MTRATLQMPHPTLWNVPPDAVRPFPARRFLARGLLALGLLAGAAACSVPPPNRAFGAADGSGRTASDGVPLDPAGSSGAAGSYLAGHFALDQGDFTAAIHNFNDALTVDPDNLELRRQAFVLRRATGQFADALADARSLSDLDPDSEEVRLLLAVQAVKQQNFAAVREELDGLPARGVGSIAAPILDAWAQFGGGDRDGAIRVLAGSGKDDPLGPLKRYHRAMMMALAGRVAEGRTLLADLVAAQDPAPTRIMVSLAAIDVQAGDRAAAEKLLQPRVASTDGSVVLGDALAAIERGDSLRAPIHDPASGAADALLGIAEALSQQRTGAQGLVLARLASYLAPDQGDIWLLIGRISRDQGSTTQALAAFRTVPDGSPQSWDARLAIADTLRDDDKSDEAVALLSQMADERAERTDALVVLGDLLRREERFTEAESAYTKAIQRTPVLQPDDWRLFYARGITYERTDRWPLAEQDLLEALKLAPDQPFVLNYLGYSWVDKGLNLPQAEAMLQRAVQLKPQDGFIVDSLGWAYFRLGEYDKAVEQLEQAVELEPSDPVLNDHLGDAYWRVGRQREARFQWQRALTMKPAKDEVAGIEGKLQRGLPGAASDRG